ncbi:MAG: SDR family oxidoreductase [Candidatus Omnitrophota bacterium]|nr:SDR family oxidoreductase [Candidatus Omnitrophota bacterium]
MALVNTKLVCVVGGSGQIGQRVTQVFAARGRPVVCTYYRNQQQGSERLDAADAEAVLRLMRRLQPSLIVNSVNAQGGTDACEMDPELARRAHVETARNLVDAARSVGARFVQISTDYVFDGQTGPYSEAEVPAPLSRLGQAKLDAERYAMAHVPDALVVRTSFVFSWAPQIRTKNFVMHILQHSEQGTTLRVPTDQMGNVTYAPNFAAALVELVELGVSGCFHLAGTTWCSKYDWARRVVEYFGLRPDLIQGVPTRELRQVGPRPLRSGLRLEKVQRVLKRTKLLSLEEGLTEMKRERDSAEVPVGVR